VTAVNVLGNVTSAPLELIPMETGKTFLCQELRINVELCVYTRIVLFICFIFIVIYLIAEHININ